MKRPRLSMCLLPFVGAIVAMTAVPARAQTPVAAPDPRPQSQTDTLLTQLFENVSFWSEKGQPEIAARELERLLILTPRDPNTLAIAARLAFQIGEFDSGDRYRAQLRAVAPGDPRLVPLTAERMLSPADRILLKQARDFVAADRKEDAVNTYREIFKDGVPDSLAIEYYIALGMTSPNGFKEASQQLSAISDRWPGDASFKLALAKLQTYGEATRPAGLDQLRDLSHVASVAAGARAAWRVALLWQGADAQTRDQINQYLAENPPDPEMAAKLKDVEASIPDAGLISRMLAYEAGVAGHPAEAEKGFLAALDHNPDDAEAMIMLSIIRRTQKRLAESDKMIARAIELAPERRDEFVNDIGFDPAIPAGGAARAGVAGQAAGNRGDARDGGKGDAAVSRAYARVNRLADQGDYAGAEAELRRLMGRRPPAGGYVQLGYLQLRSGQLAPAEDSFRRAMATSPRARGAAVGLATVLERQGRSDEADKLLADAGDAAGAQGVRQVRASILSDQAKTEADPAKKAALLRDAVAADPASPWTRLELARALDARNQHPEAQQVMDAATAGARPSKDQVQAALLYARERGDVARAAQLVEAIPLKDRTPEMKSIQQQAAVRADMDSAAAGGDRAATRARLLQVAARPDPTGMRAAEVSKRLLAMHDKAGAREAIRLGLANTQPQTAAQRLAYVAPLLDAGFDHDANALAGAVDPTNLDQSQRSSLEGMRNGLAIQQSDTLNKEGNRAAAYEALAPRLARKPNAPDLNLALSRLYTADKKPEQALRINEAVLGQNPSDLDTRRAAVDSAIQAGDHDRANELIATAEQQAPDDYRTQLMIADLARSRGNSGRALAALRRARELRQQQVGGVTGG